MSVWCDLRKRSSGEITRREDRPFLDEKNPNVVVYDMSEFNKTLNETLKEIEEQHKKLEKQMKKITGILKSNFNI